MLPTTRQFDAALKVVAELLALKHFKNADEEVDFETASVIARKHGYRADNPPPGSLVV